LNFIKGALPKAGMGRLLPPWGAAPPLAASEPDGKRKTHAKTAPLATYKILGNFISIPLPPELNTVDRQIQRSFVAARSSK
jgi:hypothetical protein